MVQREGFRVTVKRPSGEQFPEVQDPRTGAVYVVASPGELFEIHFEVLPERQVARRAGRTALYRFQSHVDGKSTGSSKTTPTAGKAVGFLRHGDAKLTTYDLFKFAEAVADSSKLAQSLAFAEGCIRVAVEEVERSTNAGRAASKNPGAHAPKAVASLPEGKKFFLAPSLTTASGGTATGHGFSTSRLVRLTGTLATLELRYETPSTLLLRRILDRDVPAHAAILDAFAETRRLPQPPEAAAEVKQEGRRVKRERGPPEVIDLSGRAPPPPPPPAERLAPGEELVCDLTGGGSDAENVAPRWSKRRAAQAP